MVPWIRQLRQFFWSYLGVRVGLFVAVAMALLLLATTAITVSTLQSSFGGLQGRFWQMAAERVVRTLAQLARAQEVAVLDYAYWDDTYAFLAGTRPAYLDENFAPAVNTSGQDLIILVDRDRRLAAAVRPAEGAWELPPGWNAETLASTTLLTDGPTSGLLTLSGEAWIVGTAPVRPTNAADLTNGWIVFALRMTSTRLEEFASTATVPFIRFGKVPAQQGGRELVVDEEPFGKVRAWIPSARRLPENVPAYLGGISVPCILGGPPVQATIGLNASIYRQALETRDGILLGAVLLGVVFVGLGVTAAQVLIIRPIAALERQVRSQADSGEVETPTISLDRPDEIGRLAASANRLLERVQAGKDEATHAHRLLNGILDSALEGIVAYLAVRDSGSRIVDFRLIECNLAAALMCDSSRAELVGETMLTLFPEARDNGVFDDCVHVVTSGTRRVFERKFVAARLSTWIRVSIVPWGDGVVMTFSDISERRERERELAATYAEVERFNAAMVGREERVLELKREVNALCRENGEPERYPAANEEPVP